MVRYLVTTISVDLDWDIVVLVDHQYQLVLINMITKIRYLEVICSTLMVD